VVTLRALLAIVRHGLAENFEFSKSVGRYRSDVLLQNLRSPAGTAVGAPIHAGEKLASRHSENRFAGKRGWPPVSGQACQWP
jgi:hypothetical protein